METPTINSEFGHKGHLLMIAYATVLRTGRHVSSVEISNPNSMAEDKHKTQWNN